MGNGTSEGSKRRVAIVTGASSGIGAATARLLAAQSWDVGITYRGDEAGARSAADAVAELGRRAAIVRLDLTDPANADPAIEQLAGELGRVDALVNNAGSVRSVPALEETIENWDERLGVGLVGPWACARAAARLMIAAGEGGRIVNVSSVLAFTPAAGCLTYCAAKAGLEMATKVLAYEWAPHGITVNCVAPGHTATPMNFDEEVDPLTVARPTIPIPRPADAAEIAAAIGYLVSDGASYVTGTSLLVDGGLLLQGGSQRLQETLET